VNKAKKGKVQPSFSAVSAIGAMPPLAIASASDRNGRNLAVGPGIGEGLFNTLNPPKAVPSVRV
jgi:hypothetical protein